MKRKGSTSRSPHKLALYRRAVQHPDAEAHFLKRVFRHYRGEDAFLCREDFAGTTAVATSWVAMHPDHQAMAIEKHGPTARWAERHTTHLLGERASDLHIVQADVLELTSPRVDVTCALNFSTFIYHDRASLKHYLRSARKGLKRDGVLVIDAYGGPGAMRVGTQTRRVPESDEGPGFMYHWEQRTFDPVTHLTECRIHFTVPGRGRIDSAFIYRWRLWTLPELIELMLEAGFSRAQAWCDTYRQTEGISDGRYRPVSKMPAREDWVAYVVGVR
ncbi:MAG: hypothetical protein Kow00105_02960 [Phycisphaeraceae bacterium]